MGKNSVNETTNREVYPVSIYSEWALPHILQEIWEAEPYQGLVLMYKLNVIYDYHQETL